MPLFRRTLLAALVLLASPLAAQKQRPDTVSLRFGWPVGMTALVEHEWIRINQTPERRDSISVKGSYRLRVLQHARGRLVVADSFHVGAISGMPGVTAAARSPDGERVLSLLGNLQPSYVVSTEGEFLEIAEVERMKAAMDSMLGMVIRDAPAAPPEMRSMLDRAASREVLTASAAEQWNVLAGTWIGADWEVGEAYALSAEEPVPMLPGFVIPMDYEFAAEERTPCTAGAREARCVRLTMFSEPDTLALRKLVGELMKNLAPDARQVMSALQGMRAENEIELVTEPGTLRPHSVTRIKRVFVTAAPGSGEPGGATTRVDIRTARYRYRL